jgi:molecular chaperone GrpE
MSEKKLLLEFLPILDNFERCLALEYTNVEDLNSGVTLIYKQLLEALHKVGVEAVEIKIGDQFDAQHSEALTTVDRPDLVDGTIVTVFERGFMLRDQLLRPARVIVNQQQSVS